MEKLEGKRVREEERAGDFVDSLHLSHDLLKMLQSHLNGNIHDEALNIMVVRLKEL